jgi:hypothetical protein
MSPARTALGDESRSSGETVALDLATHRNIADLETASLGRALSGTSITFVLAGHSSRSSAVSGCRAARVAVAVPTARAPRARTATTPR